MKKSLVFIPVFIFLFFPKAVAKGLFSENLFNHFSLGATFGTPGYGLDAATTVGNYFQLRAGFTTMPHLNFSTDMDISGEDANGYHGSDNFDFTGNLNMTDVKILVDIFPTAKSSFHFTVGTYIGSSKLLVLKNKEAGSLMDIYNYNQTVPEENQIGVELSDYLLKPDEKGNVESSIQVNGIKPYLGIGFGRAVPRKNRVGFMVELGCQFWGTPKVYNSDHQVKSEDLDGDDDKIAKVLSKIKVYPVISFRLCGRIL